MSPTNLHQPKSSWYTAIEGDEADGDDHRAGLDVANADATVASGRNALDVAADHFVGGGAFDESLVGWLLAHGYSATEIGQWAEQQGVTRDAVIAARKVFRDEDQLVFLRAYRNLPPLVGGHGPESEATSAAVTPITKPVVTLMPTAGPLVPPNHTAHQGQRQRLARLLEEISTFYLVDDPGLPCVCLAAAVSSFLDGDPFWAMPIGPPSSGRTQMLKVVDPIAKRHVDQVTVAGLLHWDRVHPKAPAVPRGVLVDVGSGGLVTISDFSTVLEGGGREAREALFAVLRTIYDGRWTRDIQGGGGKSLHWEGRVTFLACCTSAIDNFSSFITALGARFTYYRLSPRPVTTKRAIMRKARSGATSAVHLKTAQEMAVELVGYALPVLDTGRPLSAEAELHVEDAAILGALARAGVPRDYRREIDGVPEAEEPTRLAQQLRMMTRCLVAIGLSEREAVALASKAALDSMPLLRRRVLETMVRGGPRTAAVVAKSLNCDHKTVMRAMEDLWALGLLDHGAEGSWSGASQPKPFELAHEHAGLVQAVFGRAPRT